MEVAKPNTHLEIDRELCGEPLEIGESRAVVQFQANDRMSVDEHGLIHGGFVFGLADHAAMLAVNHPNVVLASAEAEFTAPSSVGDILRAIAEVRERDGSKYVIDATVRDGDRAVFEGTFTAFVPDQHVLEE